VWTVGANLDYRVTAAVSTGIFGSYTRTKEASREDKRYFITGTVGYQLTRKLRTNLDLRYLDQDGGLGTEYSEFSTFVRLVYGFANVERPGRR